MPRLPSAPLVAPDQQEPSEGLRQGDRSCSRVSDIEEISGHGITAVVDGHTVAAGNAKLMKKLGIEAVECHSVGTIIHMAIDGQYAGHIVISDVPKPHAKEAIAALKKSGVKKTVMLTGDTKRVAEQVAAELGVDEVRSELLPGDKVTEVEKLLAAKGPHEKLAFVGDGINDAPVLTRADIGIAMGAMGSDAAIEAADVVLMDDDPQADRQGHPHLPQVHRHRQAEHRVLAHRQVWLSGARRGRHCGHVGGDLRRRRRHDPGGPQRDPRAAV